VTVMAEDDPLDLIKPRGKQDWKLESHSTCSKVTGHEK
jgi:hypothetical protein